MATNIQTTPERILQGLSGSTLTAALRAAIDLGLFTTIAEGKDTAKAAASAIGASEKGVRVLCDYLTVAGFLEKQESRYKLPADVDQFLNRRSPMYIGTVSKFMVSDTLPDVAAAVMKGGSATDSSGMEPDHPMWEEFAKSMAPLMSWPAHLMAERLCAAQPNLDRVLDIAAGHGLFGIAIAQHSSSARIVALDWPKVLAYARENAERSHIADRYQTLSGSAFEVDFGSGYDLVLVPNFLRHFGTEANVKLLRKVKAAVNPGGRAALLEFVPNPDRVSPPMPAQFAMFMLTGTEEGDAYTLSELSQMLGQAGFNGIEAAVLAPSPWTLVVAKA